MNTVRKLRFAAFVFLAISVLSTGSGSRALAQLNPDQLNSTIEFLSHTSYANDPDHVLAQIRSLKGRNFREVYDLARKQLLHESQAVVLDSRTIIAWTDVLGSISVSDEIVFFQWLISELRTSYPDHPEIESMIDAAKRGYAAAKSRPVPPTPRPELKDLVTTPNAAPSVVREAGISEIRLQRFLGAWKSDKAEQLKQGALVVLTEDIQKRQREGKFTPIVARDTEINTAIDVLLRLKGKAPVILGETGVGKSSVVEGIAARLLQGDLPAGVHSEQLKNSIVIVTNPQKIASIGRDMSSGGLARLLDWYVRSLREVGRATETNPILVIENAHQLLPSQLDTLKTLIDEGIFPMILVSGSKQAAFSLLAEEQFATRITPIQIQELDEAATFGLIKQTALADIERTYRLKVSDEVITAAIDLAGDLMPDLKRPDAPIRLLQDAAIYANRLANGRAPELTLAVFYELAAKKARLPVVPHDRAGFIAKMDELRAKIKSDVKGQDATIDRIVNLFAATMTAKGKKTRAAVIVGTTGTGKSLIPSRLVHYFYGTHTRMLKIDGNQLKSDDNGFYLFGPKSGYLGSDKNKGLLANHFDGPGQGSSIILVDELDKMHPQQVERLMEIIDTGSFIPGDGRMRTTGRVLWLFTSNKGATKFFPPEFVKTATLQEIQKRLLTVSANDIKEAFIQQESFARADEVLKPEILSRMDEMILVAPILKETALDIARIKVRDEIETYRDQGLGEVTVDETFVNTIVNESYDPVYGVRELERNIRNHIARVYDAHIKEFGPAKKIAIKTLPPMAGTSFVQFQAVNERSQSMTLLGPKLAYENALFDPSERQILKTLEAELNARVYGQSFYAKKLAESIRKNAVDAGSPKPVSIYALGMTGNGKTEMARALAMVRFGSAEYLCKLEMGQVSSVKDLSNIFQSSVGYVGSDQPGQFERFLQRYPKGVILFDEMGNAGGNDKNAKEEIGKYLYSILDDGVWVSPVTKKSYPLKDYVFIFTGNEAEKVFAGNTQDDMLRAIWSRYSSEERARALLRESGLSPAFVGRLGAVVLTEPPVSTTKAAIVKKLVNEWIARVEAKQPVRILYDGNFIETVSRLTYSSTEGARSVINFVNTTLGSAASQGVFEVDFTKATMSNRALVKLSLETKIPTQPFYEVTPDETLAKLIVSVHQDGAEITRVESDFTRSAKFIKQIRLVDAYATAFHEAGHAILNNPATSGRKLAHLTIVPADHYLGYARYEDIPNFKTNFTLSDLRARLATLVAGSEAELLVGREMNSGQAGDLLEERRLLTRAATQWGLVPELMGAKLDDQGNAVFNESQQKLFQDFASRELSIARERARDFIVENWTLEYKVAHELLQHGEISGKRFLEVKAEVEAMSPEARSAFAGEHSPEAVKTRLQELDRDTCSRLLK